ncbi:5-formyltetrahydrofolate cyclo-ligase, partial [Salmonella enterica subsp. enterica serovar Enteritidis]
MTQLPELSLSRQEIRRMIRQR